MRRAWIPLLVLSLVVGCGSKLKRLSDAERTHYDALRVWMQDDDRKQYLKLKTEEERNAWLKERGLWDRFYQYDAETREQIAKGEVEKGWTEDQVFMAWGPPHERRRLTGRPATRSELFVYRFEVSPEGYVVVWAEGSKTAHKAIELYQMEVYVDDGVVTEMLKKEGW